jgi:hypothetical protein
MARQVNALPYGVWPNTRAGSGKSYTMMGTQDDKGVIPRICQALFDRVDAVCRLPTHA